MEGMEATTDLFINLIQNNRIIYDQLSKDFKNTRKKEEAWQSIANQSRMTVEGAKKRYLSLRQKYYREKRNGEVKRRNKTAVSRNWVYYERLNFLDSLVQPRTTYTNDPFVEEDAEGVDEVPMPDEVLMSDEFAMPDDVPILNECGVQDTNEADGETSNTIEIELEAGINIDDFGTVSADDTDNGINACVQLESSQSGDNDPDHEQSGENIWNCHERIVSEYSQEESIIEYHSPGVSARSNENHHTIGDGDVQNPHHNDRNMDDGNSMDFDNYISPHPSTSSSIRNITIPPYPSRCYDPKTGEIVVAQTVCQRKIPSNNHQSNSIRDSSQQQQSSSIRKNKTASTQPARSNQTLKPITSSPASTIRSNQSTRPSSVVQNSASSTASTIRSNQPTGPSSVVQNSVQVAAATTIRSNQSTRQSTVVPNSVRVVSSVDSGSSKEKRIEAIRLRMESCLTAITNKVSDKAQKSPHGPFLSYLGTRLTSVPKERLPKLEREILDLVDQYVP